MKRQVKKGIQFNFNLKGKTIPILTIVALFLVGTGSAALLTSFGTVQGTAEVIQAVTVDNSNSGNSSTYTFNGAVGGDLILSGEHTIQNNQDRTVHTGISSTIEGTSQDSFKEANVSHLTYYQKDVEENNSYSMEVRPVKGDYIDDYAVRINGSNTGDYAMITYANNSITSSSIIKFDINTHTETTHDGLNNYEMDEFYLINENQTLHPITQTTSMETINLSNASYYKGNEPNNYGNIVGIAFGFGDASNLYKTSDYNLTTINATLDNVRINGANVDEKKDHDKNLLATGNIDRGNLNYTARYGFYAATQTSVELDRGTYTVETTIAP